MRSDGLLFLARTANAALTVRPALAVVAALTATGAFVSNAAAAFSGFRLGVGLKGLFEVGRHGDYMSFKGCAHAKPYSQVESQGGE